MGQTMEPMNNELHQIEIGGEEIDLVEKYLDRFDFPTIHIGDRRVNFNKPFAKLLDGFGWVKYYTTTNFLIIEPRNNSAGAFSVTATGGGAATALPVHLASKKIKHGCYKVYRCKMGYAIKRYEPFKAGD